LISLPCAPYDSTIKVKDLHERPYVEMTLHWLKEQNISYAHQYRENIDIFNIKGGQQYKKFNSTITGDFSSASYLIAAAALTPSHIVLQGLDMQEPQGDKRLVNILQEMGADIVVEPNHLVIRGGNALTGAKIDANDIPDLLPTLAVIGTQAKGKMEIYNVQQARIKETDRIHSMTRGLRRMGAIIDEHRDGMTVYKSTLSGAKVKGFGDHRTIMALALAGMLADGSTIIDNGEAINKTFPTFIDIMQSLGAKMELINEING
jgi:3-phosphoshikimate 1-carboxyvinyltransferase